MYNRQQSQRGSQKDLSSHSRNRNFQSRPFAVQTKRDPGLEESEISSPSTLSIDFGSIPLFPPNTVQRKGIYPVVQRSLYLAPTSGGRPLDEETKAIGENYFQRDLSSVNVVTGSAADKATSGMGAKAYTQGNNIVVNRSAINDKHTILHEVAHTVQQSENSIKPDIPGTPINSGQSGINWEKKADEDASRALRAAKG